MTEAGKLPALSFTERERKLIKYRITGGPEEEFLENVRSARDQLATQARVLSTDAEKLQASHSPN
jgi:hypothetical protein